MFTFSWIVIGLVTLFDVGFALAHKESFSQWELNPLARSMGIYGASAYRIVSVLLAARVISKSQWKWGATIAVLLIHLGLVGWYVAQ